MSLTDLERSILDWFARRSGSEELRLQCETAVVLSRSHTGPGQVTQLQCAPDTPLTRFPTNCVPNAPLITSALLPHGAGVDLWLENGRIAELEIVTFGGNGLPIEEFPFQLVEAL